jgi:hypothetical protein
MTSKLTFHIDSLIAAGVEFQVGLRGGAQPLGPAKVERIEVPKVGYEVPKVGYEPDATVTLYRMLIPAQLANPNARASTVIVPIVFDGDDVLIVIEAPLNKDGEAAIIPMNGGRTPGGLHIPGR